MRATAAATLGTASPEDLGSIYGTRVCGIAVRHGLRYGPSDQYRPIRSKISSRTAVHGRTPGSQSEERMEQQHRNVLVLSGCQATLQITGATMISVTGLAGYALAEDKALATVPLTCYVVGSAFTTIPASLLMRRVGRRAGFQAGTAIGVVGSAICSYAIVAASFWLLCLGMFFMGIYTAFGKYYRFAAADAAHESFRAKAISLTLAGGLFGGIIGPELVSTPALRRSITPISALTFRSASCACWQC